MTFHEEHEALTLNENQQRVWSTLEPALTGGGFVAAWVEASGTLGDISGTGIHAQVFNSTDNKVGGEFLVNTTTLGNQQAPSVATGSGGGFIVTWSTTQNQTSGSPSDIYARQFDASGAAVAD